MFICVTHVDAATGIPCTVAPMAQGPAFPNVKGLVIEFGNQTKWPTNEPLFFGTCDDDADVSVDGVVRTLTAEEYAHEQFMENDTKWVMVRTERNHRLMMCDWTQLPDAPVDAAAWAIYRQALRDITDQTDPFNIICPEQHE